MVNRQNFTPVKPRKKPYYFAFLLGALLFLSTFAGQNIAVAVENKNVLTYGQIRNHLMDFADEYMQMVGQASDTLQKLNSDPDARGGIHSIKLFSCSAAFSIAVDSNPHTALLDMVLLVHLQGEIWREGGLQKKLGNKASVLLNVQSVLENDIDALALRVLTPEQLGHLKNLVGEWRKLHPDQRYVSYIRFSDLADTRSMQPGKIPNLLSIGGLLSAFQLVNVDEASRSVDQARMVAERALYLSQRMPLLLRWQTEMLYYEMASTPETKNILATSQALRNFPEEMTKAGLILLFAAFVLAILYRIISKKI